MSEEMKKVILVGANGRTIRIRWLKKVMVDHGTTVPVRGGAARLQMFEDYLDYLELDGSVRSYDIGDFSPLRVPGYASRTVDFYIHYRYGDRLVSLAKDAPWSCEELSAIEEANEQEHKRLGAPRFEVITHSWVHKLVNSEVTSRIGNLSRNTCVGVPALADRKAVSNEAAAPWGGPYITHGALIRRLIALWGKTEAWWHQVICVMVSRGELAMCTDWQWDEDMPLQSMFVPS